MRLADWVRALGDLPALDEYFDSLGDHTTWSGITPEARAPLLAAAWHREPRTILLVTSTYERALQWQARLGICGVPKSSIRLLPSGLLMLFEDAAPDSVALSDRIGALRSLVDPEPTIVISTPQAALERTLSREDLERNFLNVSSGQKLETFELGDLLHRLGYEIAEPVRVPGQFARRGSIVDVFPMGFERPIRIEFFDNEVERLREFNPMNQRSLGSISSLVLAPSRETLYPDSVEDLGHTIRSELEVDAAKLPETASQQLMELVQADLNSLEQRLYFDRLDLYRPLLHPDSGCAIDLLPKEGLLVIEEPFEIETIATRTEEELASTFSARIRRGEMLSNETHDFVVPHEHFGDANSTLFLSGFGGLPRWAPSGTVHELEAKSLEGYRGQAVALTQTLKNWLDAKFAVVFGTDQPSRSKTVLAQAELFPATDSDANWSPGLHLSEGNLAGGFVLPSANLALLTDQELFGVGRLRLPQRKFSEGVPIATVLDLKPGDYVVHINFGIGVFRGLIKRRDGDVEKEYLFLEYAAPDKLYVPADQLDRIQKYLAPGDVPPKVNRLRGGEWQRTVGKAREEARAFARDLIKLYAERHQSKRPAYPPDSPWQSEMESTFPWSETPSQLSAIVDVKADLETDYPMDRLVCGDVGFGKTEVAIRAAFKATQAGKQVAMLCPTTILSEQHFRNFQERLAAFPVRIRFLNRFTPPSERRAILRDLEAGELDILIGTHALLSKSLKFKDLGLLIIDEEQKFGVKHKEALKALRVNVDVLTLSATPIPRTLSMAMMHIRQMSLINDPPPGRLPIRTYVRPYSGEVVREAILRELARGGQVYYVFNRVESIHHVYERLRKMLPNARIAVGHGQMSEKEIEPVMLGFVHGEIDILLSTTIIENGLDIANANTLIVENAERFGLAQLYQLRGRVGRSDRQAHAYLLYNSKSLNEAAMSRLEALQEFSSLGSGYSLAFRDLQIRGAGDLLGAKQSGQINAVGYELYSQLIESEVQFLKTFADGERADGPRNPLEGLEALPSVEMPINALIPDNYVEDLVQRLYYYKLMMSSRDLATLQGVAEELRDRYGRLPQEVQNAIEVMRIRLISSTLGISDIEGKGGRLSVGFSDPPSARVINVLRKKKGDCYVASDRLVWPFTSNPLAASMSLLERLGDSMREVEEQRAAIAR